MNINRIFQFVAAAGVIAALTIGANGLASTAQAPPAGLTGTWLINIAPSAGGQPAFQALWTINADGTMTEVSDGLATLMESPAHGVWAPQGKDYALTFELFTFDEKKVSNGRVRVRNLITLDKPDHFKSQVAVDLIGKDGKVTPDIDSGTSEGTRMQLGPLPSAKSARPIRIGDVVQNWVKAFNARDAEALKATMADDIVMKIVYGKPDDPMLEGKDAVLEVMKSSADDHFTLEVSDLKSDSNKVAGSYSGIGDDIRAHNVGPEIGMLEAVIENGLIKTFTFTVDSEFNKKYEDADTKLKAAASTLPALGSGEKYAQKIEDIVGIWRGQASGDPGDPPTSFWQFKPDGTYAVAFTAEQIKAGESVEVGKVTLENGKLTLQASTGCVDTPEEKTGTYVAKLVTAGQNTRLMLVVESDGCKSRKNSLRAAMPSVK